MSVGPRRSGQDRNGQVPDFIRFLSTLKEHMSAELTRSDVLRGLIWPNGMLLVALVSTAGTGGPSWLLITFAIMLGLFLVLYAASYVYFALTDPDALRSEKYKLQKMAIEQNLYGDNGVGLLDAGGRGNLIEDNTVRTELSNG